MTTTVIIHENATEEQVEKAIQALEGLLSKYGVTEWKREGRKIIFDKTIAREDKGAFLMIPRVASVVTE